MAARGGLVEPRDLAAREAVAGHAAPASTTAATADSVGLAGQADAEATAEAEVAA